MWRPYVCKNFFLSNIMELKNELYGALFITGIFLVVSFLTYKSHRDDNSGRSAFLLKGGLLTFGISYLVLYFMVNNSTKEVMDHIITEPPDF